MDAEQIILAALVLLVVLGLIGLMGKGLGR